MYDDSFEEKERIVESAVYIDIKYIQTALINKVWEEKVWEPSSNAFQLEKHSHYFKQLLPMIVSAVLTHCVFITRLVTATMIPLRSDAVYSFILRHSRSQMVPANTHWDMSIHLLP